MPKRCAMVLGQITGKEPVQAVAELRCVENAPDGRHRADGDSEMSPRTPQTGEDTRVPRGSRKKCHASYYPDRLMGLKKSW
jgi:hypothetical protein